MNADAPTCGASYVAAVGLAVALTHPLTDHAIHDCHPLCFPHCPCTVLPRPVLLRPQRAHPLEALKPDSPCPVAKFDLSIRCAYMRPSLTRSHADLM